jgi:hypothetical protein
LNHFTVPRAIVRSPIADPDIILSGGSAASPLIGLCTRVIEDPRRLLRAGDLNGGRRRVRRRVQIPTHSGQVIRGDAGRDSDLRAADHNSK